MREWDGMIARQVSADGVRTTWGEHVAPPGGEVTMTDDRILSAEEVRYMPAWKQATAIRLARSHEALRARLTEAEQQAAEAWDAYSVACDSIQDAVDARIAAEAERDQAIRERDEAPLFGPVESARVRITDLPCAETATRTVHDNGSAEAQVAALTAERDEERERVARYRQSAERHAEQMNAINEALDIYAIPMSQWDRPALIRGLRDRVAALTEALRECSVQAWHGRAENVRAIVDTVLDTEPDIQWGHDQDCAERPITVTPRADETPTLVSPEGSPAPSVCPTCGSTERGHCAFDDFDHDHGHVDGCCPDPWHQGADR